jgi:outer membrane protein TolC
MSEVRNNLILHRKKIAYFIILLASVLSGFIPGLAAYAGHSIGTLDTLFSLTNEEAKITRHLSEFQNNVKAAPDVLAAVAEIEESQAVMEQVQAESGFKVFGSGGTGFFRDQVTDEQTREFQRINLKAGIRYPLFGSKNIERKNILEAQALTQEKRFQKEQVMMESILAVRLHYINYWAADEKEKLTRLFLENETEISQIFQERTLSGHLLDADRQEFLSSFLLARRNLSQITVVKQRAVGVLSLLTGSAIDHFNPAFPELETPCMDAALLQAKILDGHPQIQLMQSVVDEHLELAELAGESHLKSNLALTSNFSCEVPGTEPGYGLAMEFRIDFPGKLKQAKSAHRKSAWAALKKVQQQLESTSAYLLIDAQETLNQFVASEKNIDFSLRRIQAVQERVRESLLRYAYLPGDVIEKVQQARFDYYMASIAYIEAHAQKLQQSARLLSYVPESCGLNSASIHHIKAGSENILNNNLLKAPLGRTHSLQGIPDPEPRHRNRPAAIESFSGFSVYVWDSEQLFHQYFQDQDLFHFLKDQEINRLLISFTMDQIKELSNPMRRKRLETIIKEADRQGVRMDLLLGEPLWILPKFRQELLALIEKFSDFPFKGIHLDLEPNQLASEQYSETYLLRQLIRTLQAAKRVSRLPIGLSIHFRYLQPGKQDFCFGCALENLDLEEVTLMIYVSNPLRVAQLADPILNRYPKVKFSIAQSVEPILMKEESYFTKTKKEFRAKMNQLYAEMKHNNFSTIFIQSWEDLEGMRP